MVYPLYPILGSETVLNDPGHYIGYFQALCPSSLRYPFVASTNWDVIYCEGAGTGTHGGCSTCAMSLIELQYVGLDIEPPIEEPIKKNNIWWYILILIIIILMMRD